MGIPHFLWQCVGGVNKQGQTIEITDQDIRDHWKQKKILVVVVKKNFFNIQKSAQLCDLHFCPRNPNRQTAKEKGLVSYLFMLSDRVFTIDFEINRCEIIQVVKCVEFRHLNFPSSQMYRIYLRWLERKQTLMTPAFVFLLFLKIILPSVSVKSLDTPCFSLFSLFVIFSPL